MRHLRLTPVIALALSLTLGVAGASPAAAEPTVVKPGKVVLPLSGLQVDLPRDRRPGFTWNVSGSYALSGADRGYDARDVIDEKVKDALVAGTWVLVGYFTAGDCRATVNDAAISDAWDDARELYKVRWEIRGGRFDLGGDLGAVHTVVLCSHSEGKKDLLLYHFFLDAAPTFGRDQALAALPKLAVLERVAQAWQAGRVVPGAPLRRPEVRVRGEGAAQATVTLKVSGITLTLPDDGFVWTARTPAEGDGVDWLDRMAPALPEVTVELMRVPDADCATILAAITTPQRPDAKARNVPAGWIAGTSLEVDGAAERVVCHNAPRGATVVGLFDLPDKGPAAGDFGPLAPLLAAIAAAPWP